MQSDCAAGLVSSRLQSPAQLFSPHLAPEHNSNSWYAGVFLRGTHTVVVGYPSARVALSIDKSTKRGDEVYLMTSP